MKIERGQCVSISGNIGAFSIVTVLLFEFLQVFFPNKLILNSVPWLKGWNLNSHVVIFRWMQGQTFSWHLKCYKNGKYGTLVRGREQGGDVILFMFPCNLMLMYLVEYLIKTFGILMYYTVICCWNGGNVSAGWRDQDFQYLGWIFSWFGQCGWGVTLLQDFRMKPLLERDLVRHNRNRPDQAKDKEKCFISL